MFETSAPADDNPHVCTCQGKEKGDIPLAFGPERYSFVFMWVPSMLQALNGRCLAV